MYVLSICPFPFTLNTHLDLDKATCTADLAFLPAVRHFKLNLDEAAVINSVAVTASNICVLDSWQMAQAVAASYPHVMNYEILHALEKRLLSCPLTAPERVAICFE